MVERIRVQREFCGPTRTEQSHKGKCDVNNVIRRYRKTGDLPRRLESGVYGDFTSVTDYHSCLGRIQDARDDFMAIPSAIRRRFANDPARLIEFLSNDDNRAEAEKLGLVPISAPVESEPVSEPPADVNVDDPATTPDS